MRKMALELNISRRAIQKVVKRDLGMRSFKRKKVQFLSGSVKEKRVSRSKSLLALHAIGVLENTIFSDEKFSPLKRLQIAKTTESSRPQFQRSLISSDISVG
ncbi:hypothetical protein LOD99_13356 [Oopsacas minuta]|uniref:Uncharacterized protein n=1 Tax=Oopsacas minuta TaxID=111878 RepID=A0AAV7KKB1_9METZ|nr:hypothetical protein LOD99_13356 [Oopsacas minuta]